MQYGHIVAMIDACLERLQAARKLLSTSYDSAVVDALLKTSKDQVAKTKKVRPAIRLKKVRKEELLPSLFDISPQVESVTLPATPVEPVRAQPVVVMAPPVVAAPTPTVTKVAASREVIATALRPVSDIQIGMPALRKKHAPLPSALVSPVPSGPVFIPAAQVRENTQKRAEAKVEQAPATKAAAAPLTAEMLAKRWLQSPAH